MEYILAIFIGIGLSISCGFRLFSPLLLMSIFSKFEILKLAEGFEWVSSTPALISFAVATVLEIVCYYVPVIDNFLRGLSVPLAAIAGTMMTVSVIGTNDSAFLSWSLALLSGGSFATMSSLVGGFVRSTSSVMTAGIANPVISFFEGVLAFVVGILAIVFPFLVFFMVIILLIVFIKLFKKVKIRLAKSKQDKKI